MSETREVLTFTMKVVCIGFLVMYGILQITYSEPEPIPIYHIKVDEKLIEETIKPQEVVKVEIKEVVVSKKETVSETKPVVVSRGVPRKATGKFKTYMDFHTITNKESKQYKLQQDCWTDEDGLRRYEDYYVVAMGTHYAESVGKKFIIHFSNDNSINVIVGDIKDDRHTDSTNRYIEHNGNIVEFIVDTKKLSKLCKQMGDVSYVENVDLSGNIIKIEEIIEE